MKRLHLLCISIVLLMSAQSVAQQRLEVVKFDALQNLMTRGSEKIEVINFWATWCKPCVKELPYFQQVHDEMAEVKVTLISLDFADQFESKVIPFATNRELTSDILLLDEIDYNSWIDKVDLSWTGAIPATLVINHQTGQRKFVEGGLEKEEIDLIIMELKN